MNNTQEVPSEKELPKIVFYAPILEYPPAGGPQMSVTNAIKALSQISEVHIITSVPKANLSTTALAFFKKHSVNLAFSPLSGVHSRNNFVNRVLRRIIREEISSLVAVPEANFVKDYALKHDIDILWVDRVIEHAYSVFARCRKLLPDTKIVGDTEAVYSRFVLREVPFIKNPVRKKLVEMKGQKKQNEELHLVRDSDAVTAVSELDADFFREISPKPSSIKLFSNIVDLADFADDCLPVETAKYVLLIGSYGNPNSPMDRAAKWLIEDIMPMVHKTCPDIKAYIVGRNADKTLSHYASDKIVVTGRVPSMLPYLKHAMASLVPLHYESGTRFKILETGAAQVACISTTLGAEGIDVSDGKDIIIADTTEKFAEAIIKLYREPQFADSLAQNLHYLISENYSLKNQVNDGQEIINYLNNGTL